MKSVHDQERRLRFRGRRAYAMGRLHWVNWRRPWDWSKTLTGGQWINPSKGTNSLQALSLWNKLCPLSPLRSCCKVQWIYSTWRFSSDSIVLRGERIPLSLHLAICYWKTMPWMLRSFLTKVPCLLISVLTNHSLHHHIHQRRCSFHWYLTMSAARRQDFIFILVSF